MKITIWSRKKIAFLQRLRLFSDLSATECSHIISTACEKRIARRKTIFYEGDPIQQVVMLLSGFVKLTQLGFGGDEVMLRLSGIGDIVGGFPQRGANSIHSATAQATQPCTALVWPAVAFEKLLECSPAFRRNAVRVLEEHLRELEQRFREVSTEPVGSHLSSELICLSKRLGRANGNARYTSPARNSPNLTGSTAFTVGSSDVCRTLTHKTKRAVV